MGRGRRVEKKLVPRENFVVQVESSVFFSFLDLYQAAKRSAIIISAIRVERYVDEKVLNAGKVLRATAPFIGVGAACFRLNCAFPELVRIFVPVPLLASAKPEEKFK